ncbi:unnamed protein product [Mesocestoides corti]|uniref:TFIIIC_delta domain-containing protein n=1 Tax=Mesocestoides corti TaxID=53468 RepID=A0A0R3UCD6_MESCO|nr:unnamed protein product [Mesocestoides corti]
MAKTGSAAVDYADGGRVKPHHLHVFHLADPRTAHPFHGLTSQPRQISSQTWTASGSFVMATDTCAIAFNSPRLLHTRPFHSTPCSQRPLWVFAQSTSVIDDSDKSLLFRIQSTIGAVKGILRYDFEEEQVELIQPVHTHTHTHKLLQETQEVLVNHTGHPLSEALPANARISGNRMSVLQSSGVIHTEMWDQRQCQLELPPAVLVLLAEFSASTL